MAMWLLYELKHSLTVVSKKRREYMTEGGETTGGRLGLEFDDVLLCYQKTILCKQDIGMIIIMCVLACVCMRSVHGGGDQAALDSRHQAAPARPAEERGEGRGRGVNAVSVFPPTPKNQEQCNTTVGDRSLLHYSHGSTASKTKTNIQKRKKEKKKKDLC